MIKTIHSLKNIVLATTLFLFPLFFLPFTQEYFTTAKFYLLVFSGLLLLLLSVIELIITRKLRINLTLTDMLLLALPLALLASTLVRSTNKIQALLNPDFGFIMLSSLTIFYFALTNSQLIILNILSLSAAITGIFKIVFFFQPFPNLQLPFEFQFLKDTGFSTLGNEINSGIFFSFIMITMSIKFFSDLKKFHKSSSISGQEIVIFISVTAGLLLSLLSLSIFSLQTAAPIKYSWLALIENLNHPLSAIFGAGIDNFSTVFTRVKDPAYNNLLTWQVDSYDRGGSAFLHVGIEAGLLTLFLFTSVIFLAYKSILASHKNILLIPLLFITLIVIFFPPSLIVFFIFFLVLLMLHDLFVDQKTYQIEIKNKANIIYFCSASLMIFLGASLYLISRSYAAEFYFKRSIDSLAAKNGRGIYSNQRQAILLNPFIERFHINFAQTNLLLANSLFESESKDQQPPELKDAAQVAIEEAKIAVSLNPRRASNWENLGLIEKNLVFIFKDSKKDAITAYQEAIALDPNNPEYRFALGALFYSDGKYDKAIETYAQSITLKPNSANAHYNYAWSLYQKKEYQKAVEEIKTTISLLKSEKDKKDRERAEKDLAFMQAAMQGSISPEEDFLRQIGNPDLPSQKTASQSPDIDFPANP